MEIPDNIPVLELYDIPDYEDKYCATKDGRIYSLLTNRFLAQSDDTYGYNTVNLGDKTIKVHRIIANTFLDNPNNHPHVDHINRDRKDNRLSNLRFVSLSENQRNKNPPRVRTPELRNIQIKKTTFKVTVKNKNNVKIYKTFKTLPEAQHFRDTILNECSQE